MAVASQPGSVNYSFVQVPTVPPSWFSYMTNTFSDHACDICVSKTAYLASREKGGASKPTNLHKQAWDGLLNVKYNSGARRRNRMALLFRRLGVLPFVSNEQPIHMV